MKFLDKLFGKSNGKPFSPTEEAALDRLHQQAQVGTLPVKRDNGGKYCQLYEKLVGDGKHPRKGSVYGEIYQQHREQLAPPEEETKKPQT